MSEHILQLHKIESTSSSKNFIGPLANSLNKNMYIRVPSKKSSKNLNGGTITNSLCRYHSETRQPTIINGTTTDFHKKIFNQAKEDITQVEEKSNLKRRGTAKVIYKKSIQISISPRKQRRRSTKSKSSPSKVKHSKTLKRSNWILLSNLVKSINFFKSISTIHINNLSDVDKDLKKFEEKYRASLKKNQTLILNKSSDEDSFAIKPGEKERERSLNKIIAKQSEVSYKKKEKEYEIVRSLFDLVSRPSISICQTLPNLVNEALILDSKLNPSSPQHLLNQTNHKGQTILYLTCKDGLTEAVECLLKKGVNPQIKSRNGMNYESCLQASVRWNYFNIVKLLLESGKLNISDIKECENITEISLNVRNLIKSHYPSFVENGNLGRTGSCNKLSACCMIY